MILKRTDLLLKRLSALKTIPESNIGFFSVFSLYLTLFILQVWFQNTTFDLVTLKHIVISEATNAGIDIGKRVSMLYRLIFLGSALFVALLVLFSQLTKQKSVPKVALKELLLISLFGITGIVAQHVGILQKQVGFFIGILFLIRFFLEFFPSKMKEIITQRSFFALTCFYSFLAFTLVIFLFGNHEVVSGNPAVVLAVLLCIFLGINCMAGYFFRIRRNSFIHWYFPLSLVPFIVFLSVEFSFYYKIRFHEFLGYKLIFLTLFSGLTVIYYLWLHLRKANFSAFSLVKYVIGPSVIFNLVLLVFYSPVIHQPKELFELANSANSVLNVFKFHEIPMVDFMSSHMFSEQWYAYIYTLLFGFNAQADFLIYSFFNQFLYLLLVYYFINKLFHKPLLSLSLILFFPFLYAVFYPSVFLCIVALVMILRFHERATVKNGFYLFVLLSFLIFWKLDTGSCAILTSIFFFPILFLCTGTKIPFQPLLKGFSIFLALVGGSLLLVFLIRTPDKLIENFFSAWHYITGNQAHGHAILVADPGHQFFIYHLIFPVVAVGACLWIMYHLRKKYGEIGKDDRFLLFAALYFFIAYLANAQRGLVRHGFAEQNEFFLVSTFFLSVALLVLYRFRQKKALNKFAYFYGLIFGIFISFKFFSIGQNGSPLEKALTENKLAGLNLEFNPATYQGRVKKDQAFMSSTYLGLKKFLDSVLTKKQTFLDFSNTPMLYYYCQREVPGYFNQNLQNTIDNYLQLQLLKELTPKKVPVVVFSNNPPGWYDQTDGIPNSMRYYLISEYIFSNYKPYKNVCHKMIWMSKKRCKEISSPVLREGLIRTFTYKYTAAYLAAYYQKNKFEGLAPYWSCTASRLERKGDTLSIPVKEDVRKLTHVYLSLTFQNEKIKQEGEEIKVLLFSSKNALLGTFSFLKKHQISDQYLLRLSNLYEWHLGQVSEIKLILAPGSKLGKIDFFKDLTIEN